MKCRRAPVWKLCQSPLPSHCCNNGIIHGHQSQMFSLHHNMPKGKDYVVRDTALELGLPSGTGTLIPLLLDMDTS